METFTLISCLIILIISLVYWCSTRKMTYWSERGISGPATIPFMGSFIEMFSSTKTNKEISRLKKYGLIYGMYKGNQPVLTVAEPELIKDILVKDFHIFTDRQMPGFFQNHRILSKNLAFISGHDWKRLRTIVSPTFTSGKMRKMYSLVKECVTECIDVLEEYANDGRPLNMRDMFGSYSMDVIATCAFATKTNVQKDPNSPFVKNGIEIFSPKPYRLIPLLLLPNFVVKLLNRLNLLKFSSDESANEFFFELTRHIIKQRNTSDEKHNDFIELLLNFMKNDDNSKDVVFRDHNDTNESHHLNEGEEELAVERNIFKDVSNKYISEEEILAQSWLFFSSGYETTANTLAFASYELALNQNIQHRLYQEIMTAVDANGDINYDLLTKLPCLDAFISETLRLHSPAMRLTRMATHDYKLGKTGITIEKGHSVDIPIYAIHHSKEFYDKPEEFDLDRFMPQNRHKIKAYTYLPFGGGPRGCVGMRFALLEAKLGLAQIIRKFKLVKCSQTPVPILYRSLPGLNSPKGLMLAIEKRI